MVLKNPRVQRILDLIDLFGVAGITHIHKLEYSKSKYGLQDARRKMLDLCKEGALKRKRSDYNGKYYYWLASQKPFGQPQHRLVLLDFYVMLCRKYGRGNIEIHVEYTGIPGIRPDAYIKIRNVKMLFVEIHLSNNDINLEKYIPAAKKEPFGEGIFPYIVVISDRKVTVSREVNEAVTVITDGLKMSKLEGII